MTVQKKAIDLELSRKDVELLNLLIKDRKFSKEDIKTFANDLKTTANDIEKRIKKFKEKNILLKEKTAIIDPIKLWDEYLITLVKVKIAPPIIGRELNYPIGWVEIIERIESIQKNLGVNIIRQTYSLYGNEWDMMVIFTVNEKNDHQNFMEHLAKQGWLDKSWSMQPTELKGKWIFDPVSVPSIKEFKKYVQKPLTKYKHNE